MSFHLKCLFLSCVIAAASISSAATSSEPAEKGAEVVEIYTMLQCPPCEALKKDIKANRSLLGGREVIYLDISEGRDKGVRAAPTVVLVSDGKELRRMVGYRGPQSLVKFLAENQ